MTGDKGVKKAADPSLTAQALSQLVGALYMSMGFYFALFIISMSWLAAYTWLDIPVEVLTSATTLSAGALGTFAGSIRDATSALVAIITTNKKKENNPDE